jgi:hypothetical protein
MRSFVVVNCWFSLSIDDTQSTSPPWKVILEEVGEQSLHCVLMQSLVLFGSRGSVVVVISDALLSHSLRYPGTRLAVNSTSAASSLPCLRKGRSDLQH